jgi:2-polyprenyl-3-methyl-5-hydroxy-6-metoxy-1,4-benzoquinol methylase
MNPNKNNKSPFKDTAALRTARDLVAEKVGAWGHCYPIGYGVFSMDSESHINWRVQRFQKIIYDFGIDVAKCRILDLACLDGLFSIEFAKLGAQVVGVDIRESNITRSRFGAMANGLDNVEFFVEDVTKLTTDHFGFFDVVLCPGLFYHLDAHQGAALMKIMRQISPNGLVILETHIALDNIILDAYPLSDVATVAVDNHTYAGRIYEEHPSGRSIDARLAAVSSSVDNDIAFWFTRSALYDLILESGFLSVYESLADHRIPIERLGRTIFVIK